MGAAIAQNLLIFAGVAHQVEVMVGHSEDVLPWLGAKLREKTSEPIIDMVFLDQRGSRYTADLAVLERAGLLRDGAVVVADNVLKPGAPLFLWHMSQGGKFETEVVSTSEFAMSSVEDWMTISTYRRSSHETPFGDVPHNIRVLEWRAEQMRKRAHQPDHGGRSISFDEWAEFATQMRGGMMEAGLASDLKTVADVMP